MSFEWYQSDDTTPAGTAYTLTTTAGTASSAIELHAWLNKGSSVGSPEDRFLRVYVEDPGSAGTYLASGLDALDRREFEIRIIGSQNPEAWGGFIVVPTAWTSVGTRKTFQLPAIYANSAIEIEVRINPTTQGGLSSPATFQIEAIQGTVGDVPISIPTEVTVDGDLDFGAYTLSNVVLEATLGAAMDAGGFTISNVLLEATLGAALNAGSFAINSLPMPSLTTPETDAATHGEVLGRTAKSPCNLCATVPVTWPNAITNGDFATVLTPWSGTNWAQSAGTALHTAGATAELVQSETVISGVTYRITVTVTGAAGTVTPMVGADAGTPIAAGAGVVTQSILATAGGALTIGFVPTSNFDGALDDILVETTFYGLPDDVDSVAVGDADRLLLTAEADGTTDGKWIAYDAAAWVRHPDCLDAYYIYPGIMLWVKAGTAEGNSLWVQSGEFATQAWHKVYQVP